MTNNEMRQHILMCAKSVRQHHKETAAKNSKLIDINNSLPYVAINLPTGEEYFFQEEAASDLLNEANNAANKFNVSVEDALIWQSQGW